MSEVSLSLCYALGTARCSANDVFHWNYDLRSSPYHHPSWMSTPIQSVYSLHSMLSWLSGELRWFDLGPEESRKGLTICEVCAIITKTPTSHKAWCGIMASVRVPNGDVLSTGQAAALCSVTPDAVLKWVKSGRLSAMRTPGGHYRVRRDELLKMVASTRRPQSEPEDESRPFQYCWEFNAESGQIRPECQTCLVYRARASRCYEMIRLPPEAGHAKHFCRTSCEECEYYGLLKSQRPNVLVVTDEEGQRAMLQAGEADLGYDLEFSDCEYHCSMIVEGFRPDFVVIDCMLGTRRSLDLIEHLAEDPRVPYARIILAGQRDRLPRECDTKVFALIERPFTGGELADLIGTSVRSPLLSGEAPPIGSMAPLSVEGEMS